MPVSLELRGQSIALVATLPPKPNSRKVRSHQQRISLGVKASKNGIKRAEREAITLSGLIVSGEFSWDRYLPNSSSGETAAEIISRFEPVYRRQNKMKDDTWESHYLYYYKRLPQFERLSEAAAIALVLSKKDHTRARKEFCRKLQKLYDFAGIEIDLLQYQGCYSSQSGQKREIPTDEQIVQNWEKMRSPEWRWVYGMMATFGLRDSECWYGSFENDTDVFVSEGKTGPRLVELPLYEEWIETFQLRKVRKPKLKLEKGYKYLAAQTSQAFRRAGIDFIPYALRYGYGHRGTIVFGYEIPIMARMMGHSVDVHQRTYQRFMNDKLAREKVREMRAREGLPQPPNVRSGSA